jgi:hypothetical protein
MFNVLEEQQSESSRSVTISRRFLKRLNWCRLFKFLHVSIRGISKLHLPFLLDSAGILRVDRSVSALKKDSRFVISEV